MKLKVAFLSADSFVDVDIPILDKLNLEFDITWYVILNRNPRFSIEYLQSFAENKNIRLKVIELKKRRRSIVNFPSYWNLFKDLYLSNYDILYFEYLKDPYSYLFSLFFSKRRKIFGAHDVLQHSNSSSISNKILHHAVLSSFTYVQTFSEAQKSYLKSKVHQQNAFVIPLSKKNAGVINTSRPNIDKGLKILFFGGIHSYKRLDVLIDAIELLIKRDNCNIYLTIAGNGPDWDNVKDNLKNKKFYDLRIGFVPNSEIPDLFNTHHFIVLPYQDVTQSGPLFDSFSFNLPSIVSDQQGFVEFVIDGKTGFVFQTNSIESLSSLLLEISQIDNQGYEKVVNELNIYTDKFSSKFIASLYSNMFHKVFKNSK